VGLVGFICLPCGRPAYCCGVCPLVLATDERVVLGTDALPIPSPGPTSHHCSFLKSRCGHDAWSWFLGTTEADARHLASQLWDRLFLIYGRSICPANVLVSRRKVVWRNNPHNLPLGAGELYYCAWLLSPSGLKNQLRPGQSTVPDLPLYTTCIPHLLFPT
jgi:hypothetical protein